jgi:hypothetical protein
MINKTNIKVNLTSEIRIEQALSEAGVKDVIKILSNYGFHENALLHAQKCIFHAKK